MHVFRPAMRIINSVYCVVQDSFACCCFLVLFDTLALYSYPKSKLSVCLSVFGLLA